MIFSKSFAYNKAERNLVEKEVGALASLHMTAQEYQKFIHQGDGLPSATGPPSTKKSKYRNVKVYNYEDGFIANRKISGHGKLLRKYDSIKEHCRSEELHFLERAHKISGLREQVPIEISPPFIDNDGKKHSAVVYRADFSYVENGRVVIEDVKGQDRKTGKYRCTEAFKLKWKLLQSKYPDMVFRLY